MKASTGLNQLKKGLDKVDAFFSTLERKIIKPTMKVVITREVHQDKQTLGRLELYSESAELLFTCKTLELPWLDNERQISCIPTGVYKVTVRTSSKYGLHYLVNKVKNRDSILIHHGNYHTDILGCILVGATHTDINKDGYLDVTSSKVTLAKLTKLAPNGFYLSIR